MTSKDINPLAIILIVLMVSVGFIAYSSMFIVHETQKALVLQFGIKKKVYEDAGLKFKIPFIQNVVFYDKRLQGYTLDPIEITATDQKKIIVDLYIRYVIQDPLLFFKTVGLSEVIKIRLTNFATASLRTILGRYPLKNLLSKERGLIMDQIHSQVRASAKKLGVDVRDVRIVRSDLPIENSKAVYRRMKSDRERIAKKIRANGEKKNREIKANADRETEIILANAKKQSEIIKGEGDASAVKIFALAAKKDKKFFAFYKSLEAYEEAFNPDKTTFVMSPDSEFFNFFLKSSN